MPSKALLIPSSYNYAGLRERRGAEQKKKGFGGYVGRFWGGGGGYLHRQTHWNTLHLPSTRPHLFLLHASHSPPTLHELTREADPRPTKTVKKERVAQCMDPQAQGQAPQTFIEADLNRHARRKACIFSIYAHFPPLRRKSPPDKYR